MDALSDFRAAKAELEALSLRHRPAPEKQVALSRALAEGFVRMPQPDRDIATGEISLSAAGKKFLSLSGYVAETAINAHDPALLKLAIMLHVIEGFQGDYRENVRYLVLIAHAAGRLGVDLNPIIASVEPFGSPLAKRRLTEFSQRDSSLNSLASFGVKEDGAPGEVRFVPA
jgi:hypothetical protein